MDNQPQFQGSQPHLAQLAEYLDQRKDVILSEWRRRVEAQGEASVLVMASNEEFYDDIPQVLETLLATFQGERPGLREEPAEKHGAQRWRLGMDVKETVREWCSLHDALLQLISDYSRVEPSFDSHHLGQAYQLLSQQINRGITASIAQYHALYRLEAEAQMRDLEAASRQWRELEGRRGEHLRQMLHDLRGGLSVIRMAGTILKLEGSEAELIETAEDIISTTESMSHLLNQLSDLARLEAGREPLDLTHFDVAELIRSLCNTMRPLAQEKGLDLICRGEDALSVHGDANKVQRIVQNLLLNALNYTHAGRVEVGWQSAEGDGRWSFYVRDTGPGLPPDSAGKLAQGIEQAGRNALPDPTNQLGEGEDAGETGSLGGEGIGLVIVRRLCELLEGVIEVNSQSGHGTEFRITLPSAYSAAI
jgi:signal transduction histidine kinase